MQNTEATEQEIAEITGELNKLTEKEVTQRNKEQLEAAKEEIEAERREREVSLPIAYMRGQISEKTYQQMKFESEVAYLNRLKELYAEGSQERADIESQITEKLQADKLAKFKETQDRQKALYERVFPRDIAHVGRRARTAVSPANGCPGYLDEEDDRHSRLRSSARSRKSSRHLPSLKRL